MPRNPAANPVPRRRLLIGVAALAVDLPRPVPSRMDGDVEIVRLGSGAGERTISKNPRWNAPGGEPTTNLIHRYSENGGRLLSGDVAYGPGTLEILGYPHDEFCFLLEGELITTSVSGQKEVWQPGSAFLLPRGFRGTWHMPAGIRKFAVVFDPVVGKIG